MHPLDSFFDRADGIALLLKHGPFAIQSAWLDTDNPNPGIGDVTCRPCKPRPRLDLDLIVGLQALKPGASLRELVFIRERSLPFFTVCLPHLIQLPLLICRFLCIGVDVGVGVGMGIDIGIGAEPTTRTTV